MVNEVYDNDLTNALKDGIAVVDFSATWCMPCKMLAPVLEELSDELDGEAGFYSVDVDENSDLAAQYGISSIPAVYILKNGEVAEKSIGFVPKETLKSLIDSVK